MNSSYRDLVVWQQAMALVLLVYRLTQKFPREELFGMTSQMRRAAVSIASNIAEGKGRHGAKDICQFFYMARGSVHELETQLEIAIALGYGKKEEFDKAQELTSEVARLLNGLIRSFA